MMWDLLLSHAEFEGRLRLLANGKGRVNNHQFYLAHHLFIQNSADLINPLIAALNITGQYIDTASIKAAQILAKERSMDPHVLEEALSRRSHHTASGVGRSRRRKSTVQHRLSTV